MYICGEAGWYQKLMGKQWTITDKPSMFSAVVLEPFEGAEEDSAEIKMDKVRSGSL